MSYPATKLISSEPHERKEERKEGMITREHVRRPGVETIFRQDPPFIYRVVSDRHIRTHVTCGEKKQGTER